MITALCPISESILVEGASDSSLKIIRFPSPDLILYWSEALDGYPQAIPSIPHSVLGKCSHRAVSAIDYMNSEDGLEGVKLVASAGNTIATWDVLRGKRLSSYSGNGQYYACKYLNQNVLGACGENRALSLYDFRAKSGSKPVWNLDVASDNLYTLAPAKLKQKCSEIYLGGADGIIYGIDIRNSTRSLWDMPGSSFETPMSKNSSTNAILDLSIQLDVMVVLRENGDVCGLELGKNRQETTLPSLPGEKEDSLLKDIAKNGSSLAQKRLLFQRQVRLKITTRLNAAVLSFNDSLNILVGDEDGNVLTLNYDKASKKLLPTRKIALCSTPITQVHWAPQGIYYNTMDTTYLSLVENL